MDIRQRIERCRARVAGALDGFLPPADRVPQRLHEAMRYSVLGNGKRLRPYLVYATGAMLGVPEAKLDAPAAAVELIHAYSLVHDDLPAMDDDDMRRGRPSCHRAFDEATAILVGDALQVLAFRIVAADAPPERPPATTLQMIARLAEAAGPAGMAGGQAIDLCAAGGEMTVAELEHMHRLKTGALFEASVTMAALCSPDANATHVATLERFARDIGLAFQIHDDILDVEGDPDVIGKPAGSDMASAKPTYVSLAGLDGARAREHELLASAAAALAPFGEAAEPLTQLVDYLSQRRR